MPSNGVNKILAGVINFRNSQSCPISQPLITGLLTSYSTRGTLTPVWWNSAFDELFPLRRRRRN